MSKFFILVIGCILICFSCRNSNSFEIKSNVSADEFKEKIRYSNIQNVKTLDVSKLDFGIMYRATGYGTANCVIQIIRSGDHYIIKTIEMSRSKAFSKHFVQKVYERILTNKELSLVLSKFKECEHLPVNISIENPCMHESYFDIQIKSGNNFWGTKWCSIHTYKHSKKYVGYKGKIQSLESLLLELAEVTPSKRMLVINEMNNNDSLKVEAFITYGLKAYSTKCEFDKQPIYTNNNGVGQMKIHPKDTTNWKSRLDVYEIRKDRSIHLVSEE